MADRKITELTALAAGSQATGDLLTIVDVSEAAAADKNKKITVENLFKGIPSNVGIGTSAPVLSIGSVSGKVLHAAGAGTTGARFQNTGGTSIEFFAGSDAIINTGTSTNMTFKINDNEKLRIDSSGNVGIGTTSASAVVSGMPTLHLASATAGRSGAIRWKNTGETNKAAAYWFGTEFQIGTETSHPLKFTTADTERMRIDSSGNVGIGITNPEDRLDLGAGYIRFKQAIGGTGTYGAIRAFNTLVGSPATSIRFIRDVATVGNDGAICFDTVNSERARIDSSGRMLVGTTTAFGGNSEMLQIARNGGGAIALLRNDTSVTSGNELGAISWYGNDATASNYQECATIRAIADGTHGDNDKPSRLAFSTTQNNTGSVTERMRIGQDGTTQIFSSGSTNTLTSRNGSGAGTTYACFIGQHSSTGMGTGTTSIHIGTNGNVRNTNNSYGSLSDIKLKENIVDCGSQWDDIKDIRVRKYNFKASTNHETFTQLGVIAQEVETVSPGLVTDSPDLDGEGNDLGTTTKSVNYSVLYMKAVKALQEAMDRIETLEAKVAALEAQ